MHSFFSFPFMGYHSLESRLNHQPPIPDKNLNCYIDLQAHHITAEATSAAEWGARESNPTLKRIP
jgi:hypothetical protein